MQHLEGTWPGTLTIAAMYNFPLYSAKLQSKDRVHKWISTNNHLHCERCPAIRGTNLRLSIQRGNRGEDLMYLRSKELSGKIELISMSI
jgi:hypothetical protein